MLNLLKLLLAPILIIQGRQVKRNTPRLPEAAGERSGIKGSGGKLIRLLILGDSAAAGVGIDYQKNALSGQILTCFGGEYSVEWELIAKAGTTTEKSLSYLKAIPEKTFDVVMISLGVNDVKAGVPKELWTNHQTELISLLRKKFHARKILLSEVPPMELFPALPWPLKWYLGLCAGNLNKASAKILKNRNDCEILKFDMPFDNELMAGDGFHPGPKLHTIWGREVAQRIKLHF